ncbi:MAG: hypothetical protein KAT68_14935 [Bacteroidales bacterium]|nr:hypothetical protein [Bacteroidales bacterium]
MILKLLHRITKSLEDKKIDYMLSGSIALNIYIVPRMTLDIDIVVELHEKNIKDFLSIFSKNYYLNTNTVKKETKNHGMFNIIDYETGFKIDFIVRKETEFRKLEFERRRKIKIIDFDIWIVSSEDLIISKIEWIQQLQSDKQIQDIKNLIANIKIDKEYIKKWCKKLNLKTFDLI